ncbi:Alpha-protein kinase vwkA [Psilocybe cubensis]|uniref:Alpha-protein kinase vwkA n=2 Tax=Psilocybe cubensis TaxID=181762 RepID=A0ACB8GIC6_PSICU|nr:Alpha-protein kinase vwkA [Psilocybe cubensis]KAH9475142.1 Alpha-protein kinase vwkA [Psilocybe cubensis]
MLILNSDLLFIHDCTASQTPYISGTVSRCLEIVSVIQGLGNLDTRKEGMRVGLIAFCDHGKDEDFVTKDFGGFTFDVEQFYHNLRSLEANGGSDYPEAVTAALEHSLRLEWRTDAAKLVILITDAAPHGIGEEDDEFPQGDPNGHDPLKIAKKMAEQGITMLIVACEPVLSNENDYAHDFYLALAKITRGKLVPLLDVRVLSAFIIGYALEQMGLEELSRQYSEPIKGLHKSGFTLKEMVNAVWEWLSGKENKVYELKYNQVYEEPPEFDEVVNTWADGKDILSVREQSTPRSSKQRVPARCIAPPGGWPKTTVDVTLMNMNERDIIDFMYLDPDPDLDAIRTHGPAPIQNGSLQPGEISRQPRKLLAHTDYYFSLKCGSQKRNHIKQNFSSKQDMDVSIHFK